MACGSPMTRSSPPPRFPTVTSTTASFPTRPSTWSTRRPAVSAWKWTRCPRRSTRRPASSRGCKSKRRRSTGRRVPRAASACPNSNARSPTAKRRSIALKMRWQTEKESLSEVRPLKEEIERLRTAYEQAFKKAEQTNLNDDYIRAHETEQKLRTAEKNMAELEDRLNKSRDEPGERLLLRGDRRRYCPGCQFVDRYSRLAHAAGRARKAVAHGNPAPHADDRSGRGDRGRRQRRPPLAAPASRTATGPSAPSCFSGPLASAKPSFAKCWPSSSSMTSGIWSAST